MRLFSFISLDSNPEPFPSPSGLDISKVNPGIGGAVLFTGLLIALILLLVSMNRHIKKVNFPQDNQPE